VKGWLGLTSAVALWTCIYVLGGRWSLSRLGWSLPPFDALLDVRFWVAASAVALLLTPVSSTRERSGGWPRRSGESLALAVSFFLVYALISGLWTSNLTLGFSKQLDAALMLLGTACLHRGLRSGDAGSIKVWFWRYVVLVSGLLAALALVTLLSGGPQRIAVLGGGPIIFGRTTGLLCLGSLFFMERRRQPVWLLPAAASALLTVASGSRGAVGALVAAIVTFIVLAPSRKKIVFGLASACAGLGFLLVHYSDAGRGTLELFMGRLTDPARGGFYLSAREELFQAAVDLGVAHPVLGAGLGAFDYEGLQHYPHNMLLEVFCECGAVGVVLLLLPFILAVPCLWRRRRRLDPVMVAALVHIVVASQVSGDIYDSRSLFVFLFLSLVVDERASGDGSRRSGPGPGAGWQRSSPGGLPGSPREVAPCPPRPS
jgi:hypothetical protein